MAVIAQAHPQNQWAAFIFHAYTAKQSDFEALTASAVDNPIEPRTRGQIEMMVLTNAFPAGNA